MENFDFIDLKTAIAKFHFTLFNLFSKFQKENSLTDLKRKEAIIKLTNHVWLMDKLLINENRIATIGILQKKVLALDKTSRNELFKTLCINRKELVDHFKSSFCTHTYKDFILVPDKGISITSYIKILETSIGFFGTIINEVFKPFYKELDKLVAENDSTQNYFELFANVKTIESCYNVLLNNQYIGNNTTKRAFTLLFDKKGVTEKISWTGSLPELARFIYLLHNDCNIDGKENKAVCQIIGCNIYKVACNCFSHNGTDIAVDKLKNNNRHVKDENRYNYLLKAIAHLRKPEPTTRK